MFIRKARDVPLGGVFTTKNKMTFHRVLYAGNEDCSLFLKDNKYYICAISCGSIDYFWVDADELVV